MQPFVTELNEYFAPLHEIADRYPTIDYDALLDMLIYHLEQGVQVSWVDYARDLLYTGMLIETIYLKPEAPDLRSRHYIDARRQWENIPLQPNDSDLLINAIAQVGQALEAHLTHFGLYRDRTLKYAFQGCVWHDIYEFVRKPNA
jgi:hypothetical protein